MRKLLAVLLIAALTAGLAATALAGRTVRVGETVVWRFTGRRRHNVTVRSGPVRFQSPTKRSGTYQRRMTRGGTYVIVCTIHGARDQRMRLVVR